MSSCGEEKRREKKGNLSIPDSYLILKININSIEDISEILS